MQHHTDTLMMHGDVCHQHVTAGAACPGGARRPAPGPQHSTEWLCFAPMSLALLLMLACGSGLPTVAKAAKEASSRPNLLFMMADQLRADTQGADARFGGAPSTPNLDKLAAEGLRFTNSYSSTPTCTPARAAILTGLSPW
eukprot:SAG31_NODE_21200_length_555_cov_1.210526_1_plen_140_part_10